MVGGRIIAVLWGVASRTYAACNIEHKCNKIQAETLLHSLERAAASIGLHDNAHKTEYMGFNQTGDVFTLDGTCLKLVDKFTYLGSSVSSRG